MSKLTDFIEGYNSVVISNEDEFQQVITTMKPLLSNPFGAIKSYNQLIHLAKINSPRHNEDWIINNTGIIIEFDRYKGLNFGYTLESSKQWFGKEPYSFKEVFEQ